MILEIASFGVVEDRQFDFEAAFSEAKSLIASSPGFEGLELRRSVEQPNRYVLLVRWRAIEDHTEGFRKSAAYERWRKLLHHFFDPLPRVEHYRLVADA